MFAPSGPSTDLGSATHRSRSVSRSSCAAPHTTAWTLRVLTWLTVLTVGAARCNDSESCTARYQTVLSRLDATAQDISDRRFALQTLENLRRGITSGQRVDLPAPQRKHLETGSPLVSAVSFNEQHKPQSTNQSQHLQHVQDIAEGLDVVFHAFMPLKKASSQKSGPGVVVVTVDSQSTLSLHTIDGEPLLEKFDLGHSGAVTHLALSPSQEHHFVLTVSNGEIRVHNLKIVSKRDKEDDQDDEGSEEQVGKFEKKRLQASANFSVSFTPPDGVTLQSVIPVDRGSQIYFVTGDSQGGLTVFHRNGTVKGRAVVTQDAGGIRGLLRGQSQTVVFFSSHTFGFFSIFQTDVQQPTCTGWQSPLFDVALDTAGNRVVLALSDGDVLVYSTQRGKSKACDLTYKFPHVSQIPFQIQLFRGHVIGLQTPLESTERAQDYLRELYFFNMAAAEAGSGAGHSSAVALQIAFENQPNTYALYTKGTGPGDRAKGQILIRMDGQRGVGLYNLNLKQAVAPKQSAGASDSSASWLNWFPKIGVFGVALIGVVIWNVRKVSSQRQDKVADFDEDFLKDYKSKKESKKEHIDKGGDDKDD